MGRDDLEQESGIRLKCQKDHIGCHVTNELEENPIGGRSTCWEVDVVDTQW